MNNTITPTRSKSASHNGQRDNDTNPAVLLAECVRLKNAMKYDDANGFYFWPNIACLRGNENQCGICTNGANLIAEKFGGFVAGYAIDRDDPQTLIGADAGGHDFAVVGDYIVDCWAWEYERSLKTPVLARAEGIALGKYKPELTWNIDLQAATHGGQSND